MAKLSYDGQLDILRIRLTDTSIEESREVEPGVIVDYDDKGNIVGLEILDVSDVIQHPKAAALHAEK